MAIIDTITDANTIHVYSETIDAASVAAASVAEQALTVTGVKDGDRCLAITPPTGIGVGIGFYRVTDNDEITVQLVNPTAGAVDPASGTWEFVVATQD